MRILSKLHISDIEEIQFDWCVLHAIETEDDNDSLIDFEMDLERIVIKDSVNAKLKLFLLRYNTILSIIRRIQSEGSYGYGLTVLFKNIRILDTDGNEYLYDTSSDHIGLDILSEVFKEVQHV